MAKKTTITKTTAAKPKKESTQSAAVKAKITAVKSTQTHKVFVLNRETALKLVTSGIVLLGFLLALGAYINSYCLNKKLEQNIAQLTSALDIKIANNRKIYVFDMSAALEKSGINLINKKFETDVAKLDAEVSEAQKKIKSLKNAKVKAEFSDVYIDSLRLKRDTLIEDYQKLMDNTLKTINQALVAIAIEKKVPTIFMENITAVKTKDVVDITPEVVAKIEEMKNSQTPAQ